MSNLLDKVQSTRCLADIKSAMESVGCDICNIEDLTDIAGAIRKQMVAGPSAVVNATLMSGPGVRISPVDRRGYKISANDEALISHDICEDISKGSSINKALWTIVNKKLPETLNKAAATPAIVDVELFKSAYDGVDYYENKAFGRNGKGRKTGLAPEAWYIKITLFAQCEPLYVCLGAVVEEIRRSILLDCKHMVDNVVSNALKYHVKNYHDDESLNICKPHHKPCKPHHKPCKPHHKPCGPAYPCPSPDDEFGGYDDDEGFNMETPDEEFGGYDDDEDFNVESEDNTSNCPICNGNITSDTDDDIDTILTSLK